MKPDLRPPTSPTQTINNYSLCNFYSATYPTSPYLSTLFMRMASGTVKKALFKSRYNISTASPLCRRKLSWVWYPLFLTNTRWFSVITVFFWYLQMEYFRISPKKSPGTSRSSILKMGTVLVLLQSSKCMTLQMLLLVRFLSMCAICLIGWVPLGFADIFSDMLFIYHISASLHHLCLY